MRRDDHGPDRARLPTSRFPVPEGRGWLLTPSREESDRFGLVVGRLVVARGPAAGAALVDDLLGCDADLLVARWPADQVWVPAALARCGRTVLPAGSLTYWATTPARATTVRPETGVEVTGVDDLPAYAASQVLAEVVSGSFDGYLSHYSVDPLVTAADALDGYVEWARSCLGRDDRLVLVLTVDGRPAGAATCSLAGGDAEILLAGVLPDYQRRGLYASLLAGVVREVDGRGATSVTISTQAHNVRVQRAWARFGFEPVDAVDVAHLLRSGLLGPADPA